jgi:hypothetical protein
MDPSLPRREALRIFRLILVIQLAFLELTSLVVQQLAETPPIEPFFFLLIPLVLMAWGYGRRPGLPAQGCLFRDAGGGHPWRDAVSAIIAKLQANDRTHAVVRALRHGLVDL